MLGGVEHSLMTARSFAFFYTLSQSVCARLLLIAARVRCLPFKFLFMSSALTGPFPQFVQVWMAQFPSRGNKTLGHPFDFEPLTSRRSYFPHNPSCKRKIKMQLLKLWPTEVWGTASPWARGNICKGCLSVWPFVVAVYVFTAAVSMAVSRTEGLFGAECGALAAPGGTSGVDLC